MLDSYGCLLLDLARNVPDGLICFFVSYTSMEQMLSYWNTDGGALGPSGSTLQRLLATKLVFIETPDGVESALASGWK